MIFIFIASIHFFSLYFKKSVIDRSDGRVHDTSMSYSLFVLFFSFFKQGQY